MSQLVIRKASEHDAEALAQLGRNTFLAAFADSNDPDHLQHYVEQAFSCDQIGFELTDPLASFFVAEQEHRLVAYSKLIECDAPPCVKVTDAIQLERIYVAANLTGTGIGKLLMEKSVEHAKLLGFGHLWLGAWEKNPRALRFYQSLGFEPVGKKIFMVGDDAQQDHVLLLTIDH